MFRNLRCALFACLALVTAATPAFSFGEEVLAATGQYTFFIKPDCTSPVTYYQKMVPCIERKTIGVPRRVVDTYPYPVAVRQRLRTLVTETPVGHACGVTPCIQCAANPAYIPGVKDIIVPRPVPVGIPNIVMQPRSVDRRLRLPQWFAVEEHVLPPPQKVRKTAHHPG